KATKTAADVAKDIFEGPKCGFIAGFAVGTDCVGKVAGSIASSTVSLTRGIGDQAIEAIKDTIIDILDIADMEFGFAIENREAKQALHDLKTGLDSQFSAYQANLQALYDVN